jgi:putative transposase
VISTLGLYLQCHPSRPGKPTDNAFIEAFNGRLGAECLNAHWFVTLADATEKLECYNKTRPHGAIGNKVPIALLNPPDDTSPSLAMQAKKCSFG